MVLILRQANSTAKEIAERQDKKDERRDLMFTQAIERRDQDWREFLAAQTAARGDQWNSVVGELKALTAIVTLSTTILRDHDSWERGLLANMQLRRTGDSPQAIAPTAVIQADVTVKEEKK